MPLRALLSDRTILKSGLWLFLERAVFLIKGLVLSVLFANLLPKEVFGAYQFAASLVGTACVFALPGMATAMIQAVARGQGGTLVGGTKLMLRYAIFGSLFLFLAAFFILDRDPQVGRLLFYLVPILPFYAVVSGAWRAFLTGRERFGEAARLGMIGELLILACLFGVIIVAPRVEMLIAATTIVPTLFYGFFLYRLLQTARSEPSDETNLAFGKRLSWLYGIGVAASYLDKIIIGHYLGFTQLAIFAIASIIPDQIRDAVRVVVGFVLPGFSRMEDTSVNRKTILKGMGVLFILVVLAVASYMLLAPWLFKLFFPMYLEAIPYTQVAALASLTVPGMILDSYFRARKDDRTTTHAALSGYAVGTFANVLLIPVWGIWGGIVARALSLGVNAAYFLFVFIRKGVS